MPQIADILVSYLYAVIISFVSIIALFLMPPAGIAMFLYLSGYLRHELKGHDVPH
ncbi:hypothetical protein [Methanooceanicella nereidis]|uniref:hypothetical protein n=1 Tax=Methanooceanicella nereidis TaxID=2052831 RepID=UPI001E3E069C|nr:hypothetical protein [Methanocella sp. CWC-04]